MWIVNNECAEIARKLLIRQMHRCNFKVNNNLLADRKNSAAIISNEEKSEQLAQLLTKLYCYVDSVK